ncbi:hypothetical protein [Mesorhizobium australicum]|uniref:hypothetical protein n=1 Tax=Mesorhizobium australicum TaxID=536018 RepID=UPI00333DB5F3
MAFFNQSKKETERKIAGANQEITLAVRQGIPEGRIASQPVLDALIKATARKHGLQANDLYGAGEIAQDLIKEVMDSSFISAEAKEEYCRRLADLDKADTKPEKVDTDARRAVRSTQTAAFSLALGISAAMMSATLVVIMKEGGITLEDRSRSLTLSVLLPVAAMGLSVLLALAVVALERIRRRRSESSFLSLGPADYTKASERYLDAQQHIKPKDG